MAGNGDKEIMRFRSEMDFEHAEVREGSKGGTVVSVRLTANEAARLRGLASSLGLNLSQVLRQALEAFEPKAAHPGHPWTEAFTFGGVASWPSALRISPEQPESAESTTVRTRIREKVST